MAAPKILVVDDQPINVQLLKRKLERENMQILTAYNGQEALDLVARDKPDLILLDVMMPDMDGLEVCQRLQSDEETRSIPIIFITARSTKEGKIEGLGVGAVDYITKPIDLDETLARVQTQLRFVSINRELVDLQHRLAEARRAATIGAVTQGIAHNLNNLLGVVIGYLELIKAHADRPDQVRKDVQNVDNAIQRIVTIIKQLSSLVVKTRLPTMKCGLQRMINGGINRFQSDFKVNAQVSVTNPFGDLLLDSHIEIFEEVLSKLLINAWESYDDTPPASRSIILTTELVEKSEGKFMQICILDNGRGIDPDIAEQMYEPFISSKQTVGVGMGLTVARHAMRNMGGEVTVTNRASGGAVATILHPIDRNQRKVTE